MIKIPIFEYHCENCNLVFESFLKEKKDSVKCDHCGNQAQFKMSASNFKISRTSTELVRQGDVDRYIGQDAEKRWEEHESRKQAKTKVLKERVEKAEKETLKKQEKITPKEKAQIVFQESQKMSRKDGTFGDYE